MEARRRISVFVWVCLLWLLLGIVFALLWLLSPVQAANNPQVGSSTALGPTLLPATALPTCPAGIPLGNNFSEEFLLNCSHCVPVAPTRLYSLPRITLTPAYNINFYGLSPQLVGALDFTPGLGQPLELGNVQADGYVYERFVVPPQSYPVVGAVFDVEGTVEATDNQRIRFTTWSTLFHSREAFRLPDVWVKNHPFTTGSYCVGIRGACEALGYPPSPVTFNPIMSSTSFGIGFRVDYSDLVRDVPASSRGRVSKMKLIYGYLNPQATQVTATPSPTPTLVTTDIGPTMTPENPTGCPSNSDWCHTFDFKQAIHAGWQLNYGIPVTEVGLTSQNEDLTDGSGKQAQLIRLQYPNFCADGQFGVLCEWEMTGFTLEGSLDSSCTGGLSEPYFWFDDHYTRPPFFRSLTDFADGVSTWAGSLLFGLDDAPRVDGQVFKLIVEPLYCDVGGQTVVEQFSVWGNGTDPFTYQGDVPPFVPSLSPTPTQSSTPVPTNTPLPSEGWFTLGELASLYGGSHFCFDGEGTCGSDLSTSNLWVGSVYGVWPSAEYHIPVPSGVRLHGVAGNVSFVPTNRSVEVTAFCTGTVNKVGSSVYTAQGEFLFDDKDYPCYNGVTFRLVMRYTTGQYASVVNYRVRLTNLIGFVTPTPQPSYTPFPTITPIASATSEATYTPYPTATESLPVNFCSFYEWDGDPNGDPPGGGDEGEDWLVIGEGGCYQIVPEVDLSFEDLGISGVHIDEYWICTKTFILPSIMLFGLDFTSLIMNMLVLIVLASLVRRILKL